MIKGSNKTSLHNVKQSFNFSQYDLLGDFQLPTAVKKHCIEIIKSNVKEFKEDKNAN